ncbi:hypothetical protein VHA01S_016_00470 [Vibrio halioticoli NBRC 102217]|uniref:Uncharacterized protein n=1 Tax=Vibrio halioticoli NBRC 102217 TaxID=1219072 RepID=V5HIM9_9VIBR|nr:hypothetical protein [Vibrio halioticoli]GAD89190.1 hypothetical protein VHA01S_016_00470 [Vibrio halioticoli NBRC 102217]
MRSLDLSKLQESNRQNWLRLQRLKEHQRKLDEARYRKELLQEQLEAEKIAAEIAGEKADTHVHEGTISPEQLNTLKGKQVHSQIVKEEVTAQLARERANAEIYELRKSQRIQQERDSRRLKHQRSRWLQSALNTILKLILIIILISLAVLGLYRMYRWVTEAPLIKEVEKRVEVPVEKRVEVPVEKVVEKKVEVIPDECTQIRRNGKIYIDCDGVKVDGANTLGNEKLSRMPELLQE